MTQPRSRFQSPAVGCLGQMAEILRKIRAGEAPPTEVVPPEEPRGHIVHHGNVPNPAGGRRLPVWRIRCVHCAWFDHQHRRKAVRDAYAAHLTAEHAEGTV